MSTLPPIATPVSEGQYSGDWLKYEGDSFYSRKDIVIPDQGADGVLASGTVLDLTFNPYVNLDTASGILLFRTVHVNGATQEAVMIVRQAIVNMDGMTFPIGDLANIIADLLPLGIIEREGA